MDAGAWASYGRASMRWGWGGGFYTTTGWIWILQEGRLGSTGTKEQWWIM